MSSVNESLSLSIQQRLSRFTAPEESQPQTLESVLMNMLLAFESWMDELRSLRTPAVIIAKYEGGIRSLRNEDLPLKLRAKNAERLLRECVTSVGYYTAPEKQVEFLDAKKEALDTCKTARDILGGQKVGL
jgi:hypothetical protein